MTVNEIGWYDEREDKILFINGAPVGNPPAGHIWLYADAAGTLYTRTSAGVDTAVGTGGAGGDAADITYAPAVLTDWDSDADPGDVDGALDQLAERTDDLEAASHAAVTLGADAGAVLGLTGQQIDLDTQTANYVFAGPTSGGAADPTFRALVQADLPAQYDSLNILIGDGTNVITTGIKAGFKTEHAFTVTAWEIGEILSTSGAIKIDLWVDTTGNYPPTNDDSITNGHEPEIAASGIWAGDTDIADWSGEAVPADRWIFVNVDSVTAMKLVCLTLKVLRT